MITHYLYVIVMNTTMMNNNTTTTVAAADENVTDPGENVKECFKKKQYNIK